MILTAVAIWQPPRSDPFQPGRPWKSWDWWFRPVERNAFLRVTNSGDGFTALHVSNDGKHLWAAGGGGRIVHSEDGGTTWIPSPSGTTNELHEITFLDEFHGWAVGAGNTILSTTNRGITWRQGDDSAVRAFVSGLAPEEGAPPKMKAEVASPTESARARLAGLKPNVMGQARPTTEQRRPPGADRPDQDRGARAPLASPPPRTPDRFGTITYSRVGFITDRVGLALGLAWRTNTLPSGDAGMAPTNPIPVIALSTNGGVTWESSVEFRDVARSTTPVWFAVSGRDVGDTNRVVVVGYKVMGTSVNTAFGLDGKGTIFTDDTYFGGQLSTLPQFRSVKAALDRTNWWALRQAPANATTGERWRAGSRVRMFNQSISMAEPAFDGVNDFAVTGADTVTFVGANGRIVTTSTNGLELSSFIASPPVALRAVAFAGSKGWTVGGHRFFTTDDAVTWRECSLPPKRSPAPWYYAAVLLLGFTHWGLVRATRPKPVTVESIASRGVSDNPVTNPASDALRFGPMVEGISRFFRNPATVPPLTVAINGGWGMGKSSLMRLLETDLRKHGVPTVWFNAWHHQNEESLFPPLLKQITSRGVPGWFEFGKTLRPIGLAFRLRLLRRRMRIPKLPTFAVVVVLLLAAGWLGRDEHARFGWSMEHFTHRIGGFLNKEEIVAATTSPNTTTLQLDWTPEAQARLTKETNPAVFLQTALTGGARVVMIQTNATPAVPPATDHVASATTLFDLVSNALSGVAGLGSLWILLRVLIGHLKAFGVDPAKLLHEAGDRMKPRDLEAKASFQIQFAEQFRDVTEALSNDQLVIFIDDLDRCSPDKVMQALEAVNFLVTSGRCFVVLGLAREQVESAMAHALGDVAELVTYTPEELALVKPATPPPVTDEASERENHRVKAIAYAGRYLLKLVNIELEVPRAEPEAGRDMLKGNAKPAGPRAGFWRPANVVAMAASVMFFAGLLAVLTSGSGHEPTPDVIAAKAKETASAAAAPAIGRNNEPGPRTATNTITWTGPAREGAVPPPEATRRQWIWPAVFPAILTLAAIIALRRRRERQATDSPDFLRSLDVHWDTIDQLFPTPREKKRFINRVRYLAMRREQTAVEKTSWELVRDRLNRGGKDQSAKALQSSEEAKADAEAKAAAHAIYLVLDKTAVAKNSKLRDRLQSRHHAEFQSEPDQELRQEFERLSNEIRTF